MLIIVEPKTKPSNHQSIMVAGRQVDAYVCQCGARLWPRAAYDAHQKRLHLGDGQLKWCGFCHEPFRAIVVEDKFCPHCRELAAARQRRAARSRIGQPVNSKGAAIKAEGIKSKGYLPR